MQKYGSELDNNNVLVFELNGGGFEIHMNNKQDEAYFNFMSDTKRWVSDLIIDDFLIYLNFKYLNKLYVMETFHLYIKNMLSERIKSEKFASITNTVLSEGEHWVVILLSSVKIIK